MAILVKKKKEIASEFSGEKRKGRKEKEGKRVKEKGRKKEEGRRKKRVG